MSKQNKIEYLCVQCIGVNSIGKKKSFIVLAESLQMALNKAENYTFKNSSLKCIEKVISLKVIGSTEQNTMIL